MAFEPKTWNEETPITAEELNRMEQGIFAAGIEEIGGNDNGEFIRFTNGLQICYRPVWSVATTSTGRVTSNWTYPAEFVTYPYVNASYNAPTYDPFSFAIQKQAASRGRVATIRGQGFPESSTIEIATFAIGRWK